MPDVQHYCKRIHDFHPVPTHFHRGTDSIGACIFGAADLRNLPKGTFWEKNQFSTFWKVASINPSFQLMELQAENQVHTC